MTFYHNMSNTATHYHKSTHGRYIESGSGR